MPKVTVVNSHDTRHEYDAVLYYAKCISNSSVSTLDNFTDDSIILKLDEPVEVSGIKVTPVIRGNPVTSSSYYPVEYKEVVLESDDEALIIGFIQTAVVEYDRVNSEFAKNENKLLVLTWCGFWENEYKTLKRTHDSIYLPDDTYQKVLSDVQNFYNNSSEYTRLEIPYTRTYMLYGLPGTGKTSLIYTLATELNKNIAMLDFSDRDLTDRSIRRALYKLPKDTILCLEDVDALFTDRKSEKFGITFSGILNILDGVIKNTGMVIFMTTNFLNNIDDTAMRRRVDYYVKFDIMKKQQVEKMSRKFFPTHDVRRFAQMVNDINLTPCILQKFFVRHLGCPDICDLCHELTHMAEHEFKIINQSTLYT
jgi:DNA polymerase III delta prime subunit